MIKDLILTILLILIVVLFFNRDKFSKSELIETIKYDTTYKTLYHNTYKKGKDIPFYIIDSIQIPIHDTAFIVKDYNQPKIYPDTLRIDTNNYVSIKDTISQNRIIGRSYNANLTEKTIKIETIKTQPSKLEVYLGVLGDLRRFDEKVGIGVGLAIKVPKKGLFTISATTNQYQAGYYFKF